MSTETTNPYGITREELLDLAATKLADQFASLDDITELARSKIEERVKETFESTLNRRIEEFLNAEMEKLISTEIVPVNIWGDREGKPTTIRAQLSKRAREFWEVSVDEDGKERGSWGGQPRHQYLLKKVAREEFEKAVKANIEEMVSAFKQAVRADAVEMATKHIDKLITIRK